MIQTNQSSRQLKPNPMPNKYLITLWEKQFDWDGLFEIFKILGEYDVMVDAVIDYPLVVERVLSEAIEQGARNKVVYQEMEVSDSKQGDGVVGRFYSKPNCYNKIIAKSVRGLVDTGIPRYNRNYYSIELVEIPAETPLSVDLFNPEDCRLEVESWFKHKK